MIFFLSHLAPAQGEKMMLTHLSETYMPHKNFTPFFLDICILQESFHKVESRKSQKQETSKLKKNFFKLTKIFLFPHAP